MRINRTLCKLVTGLDVYSVENLDTRSVRDQICLGLAGLLIGYDDLTLLLGIPDLDTSVKL